MESANPKGMGRLFGPNGCYRQEMNKSTTRKVGVAVLILLIGLIAFFIFSPKPTSKPEVRLDGKATPAPSVNLSTTYAQLPTADPNNYNPNLPQWKEWRRRNAADPKWEWKVPIVFYGQVLDQNDQPVEGASISMSWTDLSNKGVSKRKLISDAGGLFSISAVRGKNLGVDSIEKGGYVASGLEQNDFEYAAFFDEHYYMPDAKFPVIFRMHKKVVAEPLVVVSNEYSIPANGVVTLNLRTGRQGGSDLSIELTANTSLREGKWAAKVTAPSGIQVANDQFATEAPDSGYEPEIAIDQDTKQPSGFQSGSLYKGGKFYVKTVSGYALVEFRMVPGNNYFRLTSYLNPNPSSRNLEFDPAKVIKFR
jgi:hypothetical protein